jgi:hypothetical protein
VRSRQPAAGRADSSWLGGALKHHADELRQACEPLAQLSDEELGAQLLAAAPLQTRPRPQLLQWSRACIDFGRELSEAAGTAPDEQSWAARHGVEITEQAGQGPQSLVIAQYTTRPPRIVLYAETVRFAEAVIDILQWRTDFGDQPVRSLAIRHEIAHRTLDGTASRELSRRLGVRSLRLGPIHLTGHVLGADELVCHAFAQHQLPTIHRSALALAVALNRAAAIAWRSSQHQFPTLSPVQPGWRSASWAS